MQLSEKTEQFNSCQRDWASQRPSSSRSFQRKRTIGGLSDKVNNSQAFVLIEQQKDLLKIEQLKSLYATWTNGWPSNEMKNFKVFMNTGQVKDICKAQNNWKALMLMKSWRTFWKVEQLESLHADWTNVWPFIWLNKSKDFTLTGQVKDILETENNWRVFMIAGQVKDILKHRTTERQSC